MKRPMPRRCFGNSGLRAASVRYLAQRTGLSFATVGSILAEFVETGEVILGDLVSGTGGRPSQAYVFNAEFAHVLPSAQVRSDTHIIRACVGNLTKPCGRVPFAQISLRASVSRRRLERSPHYKGPGLCHTWRGAGCVVVVNDYPALDGTAFPEYFREKYGVHTVVSNDVNAALMAMLLKRSLARYRRYLLSQTLRSRLCRDGKR